ncbi:hypothetical protein ACFQHO_34555 [Actinomadura yumaensis]|uniref:hypothetical protein n=1 Tax=Actinomadura yumaensis TaxID=111807 RepID=UPI003620084B
MLATDFAAMAPHLAKRQPDQVRQDLAHAAASHALLVAGKCVDLGNRRESRRWWTKTRALSDESGDRLLASWVRSREALYRRGDPTEDLGNVLTVAQQARRLAGTRPSAPLVAALTAEAQTLALMGRHDSATTTLQQAESVFGRLSAFTVDHPRFRSWSQREDGLWFDKSLIYTLAGDVQRATEAQDAVLRQPSAEALTRTSIRLHRAALHVRSDPSEGIAEAVRIIDELPAEHRRTRYLSEARIVLDKAPEDARALPAARELHALTAGT